MRDLGENGGRKEAGGGFFFFFFLEQELLTRQGTQESKAQISPSALGML